MRDGDLKTEDDEKNWWKWHLKKDPYCPFFAKENGTWKKTYPIVPLFAKEKFRPKKRPPIVPLFA